jgi:hypothetical protein
MLAPGRYAEFVSSPVRLRDNEGQMKKSALVSLLVLAVLLFSAVPSHAWRHFHRGGVFIGVGPSFWWGPSYPYAWYPPPYYGPPTVVIQEPPTYIEQPAPAPPQAYWHYCPSARDYYPTVQTCPEAWIKVPPRAE